MLMGKFAQYFMIPTLSIVANLTPQHSRLLDFAALVAVVKVASKKKLVRMTIRLLMLTVSLALHCMMIPQRLVDNLIAPHSYQKAFVALVEEAW